MHSMALRQLFDLLQEVELLFEELDNLPKPTTAPWLALLRRSLGEFYGFSYAYFMYVRANSDSADLLSNQRRALGKIQQEILSLRPMVEQRAAFGESAEFLQAADKLAYAMIKGAGLTSPTNVWTRLYQKPDYFLVFFEDVHFIRQALTSYKRVPCVALPLAVWRSPWSWMGMAHEIGHYVYQNLAKQEKNAASPITFKERLEEKMFGALGANVHKAPNRPAKDVRMRALLLWDEWTEEIFADIFSALVLGPSCIESLITWLYPRVDKFESLLKNDHDHPVTFLRPLIQIEALRATLPPKSAKGQVYVELTLEKIKDSWYGLCDELIPEEKLQGKLTSPDFWRDQQIEGSDFKIGALEDVIPAFNGCRPHGLVGSGGSVPACPPAGESGVDLSVCSCRTL
jgi:hypothetical protein